MLRELMFESLRWCTRDELESMQMSCRMLRKMIVSGSGVLPLRTLERVDVAYSLRDKFQIEVIEDDFYPVGYFRASVDDDDFEAMLQRLNHTFIKKFYFGLVRNAFLRHFMENVQRLGIAVEHIKFELPYNSPTEDYTLGHSIVKLLQPRAYDGLASSSASSNNGAIMRWI